MKRVPPELARLEHPFASVSVDYYLDGGSIGVNIVDAKGRRIALGLPVEKNAPNHTYTRLIIGGDLKLKAPGGTEMLLNDDTRRWMVSAIKEAKGKERDVALIVFGKSKLALAKGYVIAFWRSVSGQ